jgi:parvulin-like peptidyl-prolyl isomerase
MKYRFQIVALVMMAAMSANAQMVASHAPTTASTAPMPFPEASKVVKSGADASALQVTGKPVVKVNGAVLTDRDLLREMFALFPYAKQHGGFPKTMEKEIRQGAMQMIVFEELVYQEALKRKMTIAPARIDREERNFKGQFTSQEEFNEYLKMELNGSEAKLKQQIKRSLLIEAMLKQEVGDKSVVTLAEARSFYEKNPTAFERGESFALQTISIIPPEKTTVQEQEEARKKAEGILQQAKATKNYEEFGLLAEKVSEDDFRVNMGDRKTVPATKLPPEVVKVAQTLKQGEVSGLIPLGTAWTIIRLNGHTPAGKATFAAAKAALMSDMQKRKYEQLRVALGKKLRENAEIQEL